MREDVIIIRNKDGKMLHDVTLNFVSRINNDGESMVQHGEQPVVIGETDFTIFCLSMTHKKWIATDGMAVYIAELIDANGDRLPLDFGKELTKNK